MHLADPLLPGILLKRYKRFLADIRLGDGSLVTAHCPNTGAMLTCSEPGSEVLLSISTNPARKYTLTLEMVRSGETWVGVNTARSNALVTEAILGGSIREFPRARRVEREVTTSKGTRLDLEVFEDTGSTYVEIRTCSLVLDGRAMFPDAVTERGSKHLLELMRLIATGAAAAVFFLVTRLDATRFSPARHIDPAYGRALDQANGAGVKVLAYQASFSPKGIEIVGALPIDLQCD